MVRCGSCRWGREIGNRQGLGQLNREIVNTLERRRYNLSEFCICEKLGFIESRIMERECEEYKKKLGTDFVNSILCH